MEDYNNYQQSSFISGLDNDTVNALNSVTRNFNDEFMNGASTSGFRAYRDGKDEEGNQTKDKSQLASTGQNLAGIASGVNNTAQLINNIITPKLTQYVVSYVSNVVMSYMVDATTEMLKFDPGMVTSVAGGLMQQYIIGPSQIMSELLKPREKMNDELIKDTQKQLFDKINKTIGDTVGKVTKDINKKLDDINPAIAEIAYYSQMGPVWVNSKVELLVNKVTENCLSGIGQARDNLKKQKDEMIEKVADGIAKQMASKANDKVKKATKKQIDDLNKIKQDALNKVKTQIINVKLKLFALIGA